MAMQFMSANPPIPGQFNPYLGLMGGSSQPNQPITQQSLLNPQQQAAFYDQMQKSYLYAQQAFFANGSVPHSMPPQVNPGGSEGKQGIQNVENSEKQNSKNSKNQQNNSEDVKRTQHRSVA
jgi:hypothetical protein